MATKRSLRTAFVLSVLLVSPYTGWARGPSTEEERTKAVQLAHLLETDPLAKQAKEARSWLTLWLIEIPDITVSMCTALLGPEFDMDKKYGGELAMQQGFSAAAFKIEHPDQAGDNLAVNTASVEGVLRTYQAILSEHPKARFPSLDALQKARDAGQLPARVAELSKGCQ